MPSHSEGPEIWLSVWRFLLTHCLYEWAPKVLARLRGCAGSPEPSLLAWAISTKFAWRGPHLIDYNKLTFGDDIIGENELLIYYMWATTWQNQQNECARSEDSDQTGRMPRLIWVFARRTVTLLVLSCRASCYIMLQMEGLGRSGRGMVLVNCQCQTFYYVANFPHSELTFPGKFTSGKEVEIQHHFSSGEKSIIGIRSPFFGEWGKTTIWQNLYHFNIVDCAFKTTSQSNIAITTSIFGWLEPHCQSSPGRTLFMNTVVVVREYHWWWRLWLSKISVKVSVSKTFV